MYLGLGLGTTNVRQLNGTCLISHRKKALARVLAWSSAGSQC
jgi:hypothetical protein